MEFKKWLEIVASDTLLRANKEEKKALLFIGKNIQTGGTAAKVLARNFSMREWPMDEVAKEMLEWIRAIHRMLLMGHITVGIANNVLEIAKKFLRLIEAVERAYERDSGKYSEEQLDAYDVAMRGLEKIKINLPKHIGKMQAHLDTRGEIKNYSDSF